MIYIVEAIREWGRDFSLLFTTSPFRASVFIHSNEGNKTPNSSGCVSPGHLQIAYVFFK